MKSWPIFLLQRYVMLQKLTLLAFSHSTISTINLTLVITDYYVLHSLQGILGLFFSCFPGANQLLWYYADLEKQRCYHGKPLQSATLLPGNVTVLPQPGVIQHDINHCLAWRRFAK